MKAEIVSIGTEILLGEITDTNATYIARQLRDIGVNLFFVTAVGDNEARITETLWRGLERSDVIITTGGLGPTVDDMTRQCVAAALGRELEFHQPLLDDIAAKFERFGVTMTQNNRQQAYVPQGAIVLNNAVGTAPSFIASSEQGVIISLPGVPREMKYLMEHGVLPYLREKMGLPAIIKARILKTAGIGESSLDDQIAEFMRLENPTVGLAAHGGHADIRITARAESEAEADAMIAKVESQIRERVGFYIFGTDQDQMMGVLGNFFHAQGVQIAICEAGTDAKLAQFLAQYAEMEPVIAWQEAHQNTASLQQAFDFSADQTKNLDDLARVCADAISEQLNIPYALSLLYDNEQAAFALHTPLKTSGRTVQLGADADFARWGANWSLGALWRILRQTD